MTNSRSWSKDARRRWRTLVSSLPGQASAARLTAGAQRALRGAAQLTNPGLPTGGIERWRRFSAVAWPTARLVLLLLTLVLGWGVAAKVILAPGWRPDGGFAPLSRPGPVGWVMDPADPAVDPQHDASGAEVVRFRGGTESAAIQAELVYLPAGDGSISVFEDARDEGSGASQERRIAGLGECSMERTNGHVWLTTCLDARGVATVTASEFVSNRRRFDYTVRRIGFWVLGLQPMEDRRCLVVRLTAPASIGTSAELGAPLEEALRQWRGWWISGLVHTPSTP